MTSKIHIRIGAFEVDFEGTEEFLRDELLQIVASVSELHSKQPTSAEAGDEVASSGTESSTLSPLGLTTGSIAAKLNVKSGPELIMAAAARFALIEKKETYTRQQILTEMKTAAGYYKNTYSNNLSSYLQNLIRDGKLVETAAQVFALAAAARAQLSLKLAA